MSKGHKHRAPVGTGIAATPQPPPDISVPWPLILGVLVALVTALVFLPDLRNGFVNWDDDFNILDNPDFRGLGWTRIKWMFTTFYLGPYQPLSWLTLGLDYALWGLNPFGYHLTNNLLHSANAAAFFAVALALLRRIVPESTEGPSWRLPLSAAFAALVFAVHPLRVESVAWVTERRDVLSGLFYLLSLHFYLRGLGAEGWLRRHGWALVFFAAALLSKAIVISLPLVLIALDFYPLRRLPLAPSRWLKPEARAAWLDKVPYLLLALAAGAVGFLAQKEVGATLSFRDWGLMPRVCQAFYGLVFYLGKTLWPAALYALYEAPQPLVLWKWPYWGCAGAVIALTGPLVWAWRRWPAGLVLWFYYGISLLPVLGLVRLGQAATADRYTYLACLGWAVAAGAILEQSLRNGRTAARAAALAAALCLALGWLTVRQVRVWRDSISLWTHALRHNPRHIYAANNLGTALAEQGRSDEAIAQYLTAIQNNPAHAFAYYNLGNALSKKGLTDKAMAAYREALRWNGDYVQAHNNLAALLCDTGRFAEAERHFRDALRLKPDTAQTHFGLANVLRDTGRMTEALNEYGQALRLSPGLSEARNGLGLALARMGRLAEAADSFRAAAQALPDNVAAHVNLGAVLSDLGRAPEAVAEFQAALRIDRRSAAAHNGWGTALLRAGRAGEGIAHYRAALRLDPRLAEAHNNLGTALLNRDQVEEGMAQYREALRLNPNYPDAHFNLANILARRGALEEAAAHYRETLRLAPAHGPARQNLEAVLKHLGRAQ